MLCATSYAPCPRTHRISRIRSPVATSRAQRAAETIFSSAGFVSSAMSAERPRPLGGLFGSGGFPKTQQDDRGTIISRFSKEEPLPKAILKDLQKKNTCNCLTGHAFVATARTARWLGEPCRASSVLPPQFRAFGYSVRMPNGRHRPVSRALTWVRNQKISTPSSCNRKRRNQKRPLGTVTLRHVPRFQRKRKVSLRKRILS